jgi:non-canonical purine NTP pyrophosphatase (RdgB/HAM1 family)
VTFPERIAVASKNAHKLREIARICADWPVSWMTVETTHEPWPDVAEPHETYLDNARAKAREIARSFSAPALADDSGIEVDALGGAPGVRSARFAGEEATEEENLDKLLAAVADVTEAERTARYRCVAVASWPDGREMSAEGVCEGRLLLDRRGRRGFGYDPVFVPNGYNRTMAELEDDEKDAISHRGIALRALREQIATSY